MGFNSSNFLHLQSASILNSATLIAFQGTTWDVDVETIDFDGNNADIQATEGIILQATGGPVEVLGARVELVGDTSLSGISEGFIGLSGTTLVDFRSSGDIYNTAEYGNISGIASGHYSVQGGDFVHILLLTQMESIS